MLLFAAVSASMQQLLAAMHGPGTTGILPPDRGRVASDYVWPSFDFLVFPEVVLFLIQDLMQPWQRRLPPTLLSLLLS